MTANELPELEMMPAEQNMLLFRAACSIAERVGARSLFLQADVVKDWAIPSLSLRHTDLVLVTSDPETHRMVVEAEGKSLLAPRVTLSRMSQVKVAVMMGLSAGIVDRDDVVVCLWGVQKVQKLDSIIVLEVGTEFEVITPTGIDEIEETVKYEVFDATLKLALELGEKGRDGKPVGTIFVLGDHRKVIQRSQQMVMNPFRGYPEKSRNILDPDFVETIKEFSAIDGAFIIRGDGVILAAGRHLKTSGEETEELPSGLGSRHRAGLEITAATDAIAIVVSESTGDVHIYRRGRTLMDLGKDDLMGRYPRSSLG